MFRPARADLSSLVGQAWTDADRVLAATYLDLKAHLIEEGFAREIDEQFDAASQPLTEFRFLREAAWAIVSGGMSERAVRARFADLSAAFCNWASARDVAVNEARCRLLALKVWRHPAKIDAVISLCRFVAGHGFNTLRSSLAEDPVGTLTRFDYLGPATARHLAKNLGYPLAKPDRHLLRISAAIGLKSPQELCERVARVLEEPVGVIDLVFWRYAATRRAYISDILEQVRSATSELGLAGVGTAAPDRARPQVHRACDQARSPTPVAAC